MAQKDIEDIAIYMKQIDESKDADQQAYNESCKECDELQIKEDEEFEDEIIDKAQLGFIDDSDMDEAEEQVNEKYAPKKDWYKAQATKQKSKPFAFTVDFCYDSYSSETNVTEEDVANMLNKAIVDVCAEAKLPPSAILASSVDSIAGGSGNWPEVTIVINNYANAIKFGKVWCSTDDVEDVAFLLSPTAAVHEDEDEEAEVDIFEEDVSDCLAKDEMDESENQGSITVEVYNEDDFGIHFAEEVEKHIPTVSTMTAKHKLPNGDLEVTISGNVDDLKKAYAFYLGKKDYSEVTDEDKEIFDSLLKYANGDTIAEADYREAVAHCLDPIGVKASTANLADQDTCAISFVKEEKTKRLATKFLKCLKENDVSSLSDAELDKLDQIKDAVDNGEFDKLPPEQDKVWKTMLKQMGVTQKEWDDMTPDQKQATWNNCEANQPLPKGYFGDGTHTAVDPKTGKKYRYREQYIVFDPKTGETGVTAFNPNYTSDQSINQHPSKFYRDAKKQSEIEDKLNKEKAAKETMKAARGKDTWDVQEFYDMIAPLDGKQRKQLMKELIDDIEKDHPSDPKAAGNEIMFVKELFNQKLTLRDFAKAWGASFPGVMKYHDKIIAIWKDTLREFGVEPDAPGGRAKFMRVIHNPVTFEKFKTSLRQNLDKRKKGHIVKGGM